jgi:hypothetical protein
MIGNVKSFILKLRNKETNNTFIIIKLYINSCDQAIILTLPLIDFLDIDFISEFHEWCENTDVIDYMLIKCTETTFDEIKKYNYQKLDTLLHRVGYLLCDDDFCCVSNLKCYKSYTHEEICVWFDDSECIDWKNRPSTVEQLTPWGER